MSGLSKQEMRRQIKRINRIDLSKSNYETVKAIINKMIEGIPIQVSASQPQDLLFRARKNPGGKITDVSGLCAPPPELVTGFQRCNVPGKPMFYCSSRRIAALLEIDAQVGDIVYLSQWMANTRLPVNMLLEDEALDDMLLRHLTERDELFYAYVDTLFTRRVDRAFSKDYMVSAAIAEICTSSHPPDEKMFVEADGHVGLKYPSIVDLEGSYNIAFPAEFAGERIGAHHVMELEILEREGDRLAVKLLDTAFDLDDGAIKWTGDAINVPALRAPKGGVPFRFDGKKWRILTTEHLPLSAEEARALLPLLLHE